MAGPTAHMATGDGVELPHGNQAMRRAPNPGMRELSPKHSPCSQPWSPAERRAALGARLRSRLRTGAGVLPHPPGAHTRGLPQRRRRAAQCPGATDAPPPVAQSPVTAAELSGGQPGPSCQVVLRSNLAHSTERAAERRMHLADQWPDAVQRRLTTGKAGGVPTPPRVLVSCERGKWGRGPRTWHQWRGR